MLKYLIMAAAFLTAFLFFLSFSIPVLLKNKKKTGLPTLSFYDGNIGQGQIKGSAAAKNTTSVLKKIIKFLRKFLPKNLVMTIKEKIEMAGIYDPLITDMILVVKFFTPVILLATLLFLMIFFNVQVFIRLVLILLVPISFILPDYYLKSKITKRLMRRHSKL